MAIAVTGATGFIGSCLVSYLNGKGLKDLVLTDDFSSLQKTFNLKNKTWLRQIHRDDFLKPEHFKDLDFVFHIGARTDTSELNTAIFDRLNLHYSQKIWELCTQFNIPLIYASSAATYGAGERGFNDDHDTIAELKPLNPYGQSKQDFDCWVLEQKKTPPFWCGLKFFN